METPQSSINTNQNNDEVPPSQTINKVEIDKIDEVKNIDYPKHKIAMKIYSKIEEFNKKIEVIELQLFRVAKNFKLLSKIVDAKKPHSPSIFIWKQKDERIGDYTLIEIQKLFAVKNYLQNAYLNDDRKQLKRWTHNQRELFEENLTSRNKLMKKFQIESVVNSKENIAQLSKAQKSGRNKFFKNEYLKNEIMFIDEETKKAGDMGDVLKYLY
jgi:hypothetical protein